MRQQYERKNNVNRHLPHRTRNLHLRPPVPSAFDPAYLDYTQRIKDLATHILNTPDNKFPRLQVTTEQPMDVDGNLEDLTWTISLFYTDHPLHGDNFHNEDAAYTYSGDDKLEFEAISRLEQYTSEYGRLVFTFDTPDTKRLVEGEKITIHQNAPVGI